MLKAYDTKALPDRPNRGPNRAFAKLRALVGRLRGRPVPILEETHA
jgi:hypothetical protein